MKFIFFDLDGVLLDSEPLHFKAHRKALSGFGIDLSEKDYLSFGVAMGDKHLYDRMESETGIAIDRETASAAKREAYRELLDREGDLFTGVRNVLDLLGKDLGMAIVSSGSRFSADAFLGKFGLGRYFDFVITGDDVERVKPFPDIYLEAARRSGCRKEECLAIEDSETGVTAAKAAGIACVAIPNRFTAEQDFSKADAVIAEISDLPNVVNELSGNEIIKSEI